MQGENYIFMDDVSNLIISNVLLSVGDDSAQTYSSGTVGMMVFKNLNSLNGLMGTCYSGNFTDGVIMPNISGTIYEGILELMSSKELTKRSLFSAARTYNITSFKEGDSSVNISDSAKSLQELYKFLQAEFDKMVNQAKYTLASQASATVIGTDGVLHQDIPYIAYVPYQYYR